MSETATPARLALVYEWNFYYSNGLSTTGDGAGRRRGPMFFVRCGASGRARRDYWCTNCGTRLPRGTVYWADENTIARLCDPCAGGQAAA